MISLKEEHIGEKLSAYFSRQMVEGKLSFLPCRSTFVGISKIQRLSARSIGNDVYSFLLSYCESNVNHQIELVLKTYHQTLDPVLRTYDSYSNPKRCEKEYEVLKKLEQDGFPAPKAKLFETDLCILGYPFIITEKENPSPDSAINID